jgi:polyhydroxyalkanoate synthase
MATPVLYALLDEARREAGRALDRAGFGPVESRFRIVTEIPGARLRLYQQTRPALANSPLLILVPAPIKRAYIWDLLPEVSVVRQCLRRGLRVYLLEWLDPGPMERGLGLADYAERLPLAALNAITAETGETAAFLAGHSLGGTFATVFASLHAERVRGLVLVDAPLAFGADRGGPLARAVAAVPHIRMLRYFAGEPVPGSFTSLLSIGAAPEIFVLQRWTDFAASFGEPLAAAIHTRVERWALDELAMPWQLFEDVLEQLYREDRFVAGSLQLAGQRTGIDQLRSRCSQSSIRRGGL